MKKTITLLMLCLVMLSLNAAVYYVGAESGVTLNGIIAGTGYRKYEYSAGVGYKASIPVFIQLSDNYGLDTGLSLYGKYYKSFQTVELSNTRSQENYNLDIKNGFLLLPLSFRLSIPYESFDFYLSAGGFLGYWLYGSRSGNVINGNDKSEMVDEKTDFSLYNRFDAGLLVKLGTAFNFGSFKSYVEAEYDISLTDMNRRQNYGAFPIHNSTFAFTLGLLWGINK